MARESSLKPEPASPVTPSTSPAADDEAHILQQPADAEVLDRQPRRGVPRRLTAA